MKELIQKLLSNMEQNKDVFNADSIFNFIAEGVNTESNESGVNRAYYGGKKATIWLENGFFINKDYSYDRFGSNKEAFTSVCLGNIKAGVNSEFSDSGITIYSCHESKDVKEAVVKAHYITENEQAKEKAFSFIDSFDNALTTEEIRAYMKTNGAEVSFYKTLNETHKKDPEIIKIFFDKMLEVATDEYYEIVEWNSISPYGGEDITYFPASAAHCFMDQVYDICEKIGISEHINKDEITNLAFALMIQNEQAEYLEDKLDTYNKIVDRFKQKDEVLALLTSYKEFMPLLENEGELWQLVDQKQEEYEGKVKELESAKLYLEKLEEKGFSWFEKNITKREEYKNHLDEIAHVVTSISVLEEVDIQSLEEHKVIIDLDKRFRSIDKDDYYNCLKFFLQESIPTDAEGVNSYFEMYEASIQSGVSEVEIIVKALHNKPEQSITIEETIENDESWEQSI